MNFFNKPALTWLWIAALLLWLGLSGMHLGTSFEYAPYAGRQGQTLISSYWMVRDGLAINYDTPLLGEPWKIPLEFPTFQILVAMVAKLGVPLETAGRLVSMFFGLAMLPLIYAFCKIVEARKGTFEICAVLYLTTPIYLYWSGAIMIDSTAIFFTFAYLVGALYWLKTPVMNGRAWMIIGLAFCAGVLGMLTKPTTFISAGLAIAALGGYLSAREFRHKFFGEKRDLNFYVLGRIFILGILTLAVIMAGVIWLKFSDSIKAQSPFTEHLTSERLHVWNWGRLKDRLGPGLYVTIWTRILPEIAGYAFIMILPLFLFVGFKKSANSSDRLARDKVIIFAAIIVFLSGFAFFPTLHIRHSYYQVANGIFLILAIGFAMALIKSHTVKIAILTIFIAGNLGVFFTKGINTQKDSYYGFVKLSRTSVPAEIGRWIHKRANRDDRLLVIGMSWSGTLHYYAGLKGMGIPRSFYRDPVLMNKAVDIKANNYKWVVDCEKRRPESPKLNNREEFLAGLEFKETIRKCDIYEVPDA